MSEEEDELAPFKHEWLANEYTQRVADEFSEVTTQCLNSLLGFAAASTDPRVMRAYGQYQANAQVMLRMKRGLKPPRELTEKRETPTRRRA